MVRILLNKGADIRAQRWGGKTALMDAAINGNAEIVRLLLENGADVNFRDQNHENALTDAVLTTGNIEVVRLLLEARVDINAQSEEYGTALIAATSTADNVEVVRLLLENGAEINAQCGIHGTALIRAAGKGLFGIMQLLIANGANPELGGGSFENAKMAAFKSGRPPAEISAMLKLLGRAAERQHRTGKLHKIPPPLIRKPKVCVTTTRLKQQGRFLTVPSVQFAKSRRKVAKMV